MQRDEQITLGTLISLAEKINASDETIVRLDTQYKCGCYGSSVCGICKDAKNRSYWNWTINRPDSWRGLYNELAFDCVEETDQTRLTMSEFITILKEANGKTYRGYKGGSFTMFHNTPVWVCMGYGISCGPRGAETAIIGLEMIDDVVIIKTKNIKTKY